MSAILYYFHDPMCGWCYAFQPVWKQVRQELPSGLEQLSILGGLAPDEDTPMEEAMQEYIKGHWQRIQQMVPGTELNYDFWSKCEPRRSTYPACRAVIAAGRQRPGADEAMVEAIQRAYYREARNPSNIETLHELASELQLDRQGFELDLAAHETEEELMRQIGFTASLGVRGYPSLMLVDKDTAGTIDIDYNNAQAILAAIGKGLDYFQARDSGQPE